MQTANLTGARSSRLAFVAVALLLAACGGTAPPPASGSVSLTVVSGNNQTATVATALPAPLVVKATSGGSPVAGQTITFAVTAGGGKVNPATATTGSDGTASTVFTVGDTAGSGKNAVTAAITGVTQVGFTASATAGAPTQIVNTSGVLAGKAGTALASPVSVRVTDAKGNGIGGVSVSWSVTSGGGSVAQPTSSTDAQGVAQVSWTLGTGTQTLSASATGLTAASIPATALNLVLNSISVLATDSMTPSQSVTVTGDGLGGTGLTTQVVVDGVQASVTSASATSVTFTVPSVGCTPTRLVPVQVSVAGALSNPLNRYYKSTALGSTPLPAVGQLAIFSGTSAGCLTFGAASATETYLVGVLNAQEDGTNIVPVQMQSLVQVAPGAPPPSPLVRPFVAVQDGTGQQSDESPTTRRWRLHAQAEVQASAAIDALARQVSPVPAPRVAALPNPAPTVGTVLSNVKVLNVDTPSCSGPPTVAARVRYVGNRGVWLADTLNAADLPDSMYKRLSDTFDQQIFATDSAWFGNPTDIDGNGKAYILITKQVNSFLSGRLLGFVSSADFYPTASCGASNFGEIFYGKAPDANYSVTQLGLDYPFLIAHEFTHIIQYGRRFQAAGNDFPTGSRINSTVQMSSFEAEGQASLAEEVNGFVARGLSFTGDWGADVALNGSLGPGAGPIDWFSQKFSDVSGYFGGNGCGVAFASNGDCSSPLPKTAGAPEQCTMLGTQSSNNQPCSSNRIIYGVPWSLLRFVSDQKGLSGGLAAQQALQKALIDNPGQEIGLQNIANRLGTTSDSMLVRWAAALFVDNRSPAGDPAACGTITNLASTIKFSAWNWCDVFTAKSSINTANVSPARQRQIVSTGRLQPRQRGFSSFTDTLQVRGASSSYTVISGSNRPAVALRLVQPGGTPLPQQMRVWVVRLQ